MSDTYQPKVGDRVKVTVEGVVHAAGGNWFDVGYNSFYPQYDGPHEATYATYTFEKIQDPEPQWVNGDVVRVLPYIPAYRIDGEWKTAAGRTHRLSLDVSTSLNWAEGNVEILYKADRVAEQEAA